MTTGELPIETRERLFVAVEIPPKVRDAVDAALAPMHRQAADAKWVDPALWHLTLAFVGWVSVDDRSRIEAACQRACEAASDPFELRLDGKAGTFGRKVLWVGLDASEPLATLAEEVRRELREAGFPIEDRPFRSHLTLARSRRGEVLPRTLTDGYEGPTLAWSVDRMVLMRSRLRRTGPRYTVEAAWRLQACD
jgi:RNA 2',3'-cyclic 3'-phosphodiesterase